MQFECLQLKEPLLRSLKAAGHTEATPIQQKAIPPILKGRDLVGCAQTGTGKTAAFALPTLQQLMTVETTGAARRRKRSGRRTIRALVLAPTRELAGQIGDSFAMYGKFTALRHCVIFGGVKQGAQVRAIESGVDVLIATPGRLLDLIGQGIVKMESVEILILDEADQMLDMGFIHDLRKIVAFVSNRRQTLMFSATMPPEIRQLAKKWLRRPSEIQVAPAATTPAAISQSVYFVDRKQKPLALTRFLKTAPTSKTLVFSRTKRGADKIARFLERDGVRAVAIHGNKSQARRKAVMGEFDSKQPPVLVATDLAARGLDFSDVAFVINYDMPDIPETYVHRIGRTARAGAAGKAISFCDREERQSLRQIEKLMGQKVPVGELPAALLEPASMAPPPNVSKGDRPPKKKTKRKKADSNGRPPARPKAAGHTQGRKPPKKRRSSGSTGPASTQRTAAKASKPGKPPKGPGTQRR